MANLRILVVDDDPVIRRLLEQRLNNEGYETDVAKDGYEARDLLSESFYDIVVTDLVMPGEIGGIEVLEISKEINHATEVMVITAHSSVDTAVDAMKKGAFDYLEKPINFDELFLRIDKIASLQKLVRNAEDISLAMKTTEDVASSTIQDLEISNQEYRNSIDQIENILRAEDIPDDQRIEQALKIIAGS